MSVYIFDADAFGKLAEIEGPEWKEQQENDPDPNGSFKFFLLTWKKEFEGKKHLMEEGAKLNCFVSVNGNGAIYGCNGYNRYSVRADGKMFLLKDLSIAEDIKKATSMGFDIM